MAGKNSIDCNVHMLWVGLGLGFLHYGGRCESNMLGDEEKTQEEIIYVSIDTELARQAS